MIDVVKLTPSIYSEQSRDYQLIARLYTALYNMNRMYVDGIDVWEKNSPDNVLPLKASTLNFRPRHTWDKDSLQAVISCFKYLTRYKGTSKAIQLILNILLRVNNISGEYSSLFTFENNLLTLSIPYQLSSIGIVQDLLDYILPAGCAYRLRVYKEISSAERTNISYNDGESVQKSAVSYTNIKISQTKQYGDDGVQPGQTVSYNVVNQDIQEQSSEE